MDDTNTLHLPIEIIEIILLRLASLKSLFRFKSVCKAWNTLISDPVFLQTHQQRSKESDSENLFLRRNSKINSEGFSLVKLEGKKLRSLRVFEAPYSWEEVLCFCDGLLLVDRVYADRSIALWNPSTGEEKKLSLPDTCHGSHYGLCHDPTTDDFKVVVLGSDHYTVYSFNNDSWKKRTKYERDDYGLPIHIGGVCLDGASYWAWSNGYVRRVVYFDPRDDKLKILQKPGNVDDNEPIYLVDLGGCLCLYCNAGDETVVRIWRKEKGIDNKSWKTLMNVENVGMSIWCFQPQCFVGNKIVIRKLDNGLVVYNPYEKRFEQFDDDTKVFGRGLVPYVDSPFFPSTLAIYKYLFRLNSCSCI